MLHTYRAPQTADGSITDVSADARGNLAIEVTFQVPREFCDSGDIQYAKFACRSRIARLGIDIRPMDGIQVTDTTATLRASVHAVVPQYGVRELLPDVIIPGVHVGRLVMCDPARRLSSMELYNEYSANAFKLPAGFSIDSEGQFTIRPHKLIYDLERTPSVDDLFAILNRPDGKSLLNRLQVARQVDNVLLEPGQGVITSCTMFLHRHFVVLESDPTALGRHMHAVVLDPVTTRGPRVFLEFFNDSDTAIVNPASTGVVYLAEEIHTKNVTWAGTINGTEHIGTSAAISEYTQISNLFRDAVTDEDSQLYFDRAAAVVPGPVTDFHLSGPLEWTRPEVADTATVTLRSAQDRVVTGNVLRAEFRHACVAFRRS